jgi:FMN reductase
MLFTSIMSFARPAYGGPRDASATVDAYDGAMEKAHDEEARGDYAGAARTLTAVVDDYKQDYAIALELAWALAGAGNDATAERAYRVALARAPASRDARLGLAWTLAREGRCGDARDMAAPLRDGDAASAMNRHCQASKRSGVAVYAAFDAYAFPGIASKSTGLGALAGLTGTSASGWTFGGAFRDTAFAPASGSAASGFSQVEGYAHAGYEGRRLGLLLEGAVVDDGSALLGLSEHVGASGRWSPFGDLLLDVSLSLYRDETVPRAALTWSLPVAGPLRLAPGFAAQDVAGQWLGNASLAALLSISGASTWVGVKWGPEERPAYLLAQVVYDLPERVAWGAWAGTRLHVAGPLSMFATYSFDRLHGTPPLQPATSDAHMATAGAGLDF